MSRRVFLDLKDIHVASSKQWTTSLSLILQLSFPTYIAVGLVEGVLKGLVSKVLLHLYCGNCEVRQVKRNRRTGTTPFICAWLSSTLLAQDLHWTITLSLTMIISERSHRLYHSLRPFTCSKACQQQVAR